MTDYPAAHSMDTEWFAVDADGHVGRFDSGENGHVPLLARAAPDRVERLVGSIPVRAPEWVLSHLPLGKRHCHQRGSLPGGVPIIMLLTSIEAVYDEMRDGEYDIDNATVQILDSSGPEAVLVKELTKRRYRELHRSGACLGCYWPDEVDPTDYFFEYRFSNNSLEHPPANDPYVRVDAPQSPLAVPSLPPDLRQAFDRHFVRCATIRFAESQFVQPLECGPCCQYRNRDGEALPWNFWWLAYYDPEGQQLRPVRGREAEYRLRFEELQREAQSRGFRIEPPPAS